MWGKLEKFMTIVGCARAAAELSRMGYHKEAKALMLQQKQRKSE